MVNNKDEALDFAREILVDAKAIKQCIHCDEYTDALALGKELEQNLEKLLYKHG